MLFSLKCYFHHLLHMNMLCKIYGKYKNKYTPKIDKLGGGNAENAINATKKTQKLENVFNCVFLCAPPPNYERKSEVKKKS